MFAKVRLVRTKNPGVAGQALRISLGLIRKKKQLIIYDSPILEMNSNIVSVLSNQFQNQTKSPLLINYFIVIFVGKNLLGEPILFGI